MLLTHKRAHTHTYPPHSFFHRELCCLADSVFRIHVSRESCSIYSLSRAIHRHTQKVVPPSRRLSLYLEIDAVLSYSRPRLRLTTRGDLSTICFSKFSRLAGVALKMQMTDCDFLFLILFFEITFS